MGQVRHKERHNHNCSRFPIEQLWLRVSNHKWEERCSALKNISTKISKNFERNEQTEGNCVQDLAKQQMRWCAATLLPLVYLQIISKKRELLKPNTRVWECPPYPYKMVSSIYKYSLSKGSPLKVGLLLSLHFVSSDYLRTIEATKWRVSVQNIRTGTIHQSIDLKFAHDAPSIRLHEFVD